MEHIVFVLTRLWRYHGLYFLKPNDAINDTLTSSLLHRLDWSGQFLEIGSGDGVFSYVMHGGSFPLWFDRYLLTDLCKTDIYDIHHDGVFKPSKILKKPDIVLSIDAKISHVKKIKEIQFSKSAVVSNYEYLPLESNVFKNVFYYTPHGLVNHAEAMCEASRVMTPNGRMLILLFNSAIKKSFLCHRLSKITPQPFSSYFSKLDNGRCDEIMGLAKSPEEWRIFFLRHGLEIEKSYSGLSTFAWKVYDIQTRPILKQLVNFFNILPPKFRVIAKLSWMIFFYPYLIIFYLFYSNDFFKLNRANCYIAYQLKKVD